MVPAIFVFLSAVMVQAISGQCIGGPLGLGYAAPSLAAEAALAYEPLAPGCLALPGIPSSSGGGFVISSKSPMSPTGLTVQTDNMAIEGPLIVSGQLPFLGVVALEGGLPVAGVGAVSYGCGTGVGITNEVTPSPYSPGYSYGAGYPYGSGYPYGPEMGPLGPGFGYNGYPNGCGCGPFY